MGVCITGKMLNRYDDPLRKLHEATGSAALIYLENIPIAHAGLIGKGDKGDEASLRIDTKVRDDGLQDPERRRTSPWCSPGKITSPVVRR